jgi:hypothetical protein
MVSELRCAADALAQIETIQVLRTRWYAEKINADLPAIIIDYSRPENSLLIESGLELPEGNYFYLEIAVKPDFESDPLEALERLETLITEVKNTLHAAFPSDKILFITPETIEMPFGKQTSLSFICDLYIG